MQINFIKTSVVVYRRVGRSRPVMLDIPVPLVAILDLANRFILHALQNLGPSENGCHKAKCSTTLKRS